MACFIHSCIALLVLACTASPAFSQAHEPNPAAVKALQDVVDSYRARPALTVKSTVKVDVKDGDAVGQGQELALECTFGKRPVGVVKLRGYTCYLNNGTLTAIHEGTDHSYFTFPDDGSPYYVLFNAFFDLPYPELAIQFGEDKVEDLVFQFHPKAAWAQPTKVTEPTEAVPLRVITLTSDFDSMEVSVDPKSNLIQTIVLTITGGDMVQPGSTITYTHTYTYETHDKPLPDSTFEFNPGQRQRVDAMVQLAPKPAAPEFDPELDGGDHGAAPEGPLVGKPAPALLLATADGDAVDLDDLKGQVVVLDFWATWCGPCMSSLPKVHELARWAKDEQLPVTVLTVNVFEVRDKASDNPDLRLKQAQTAWKERKFTLPIAMDYTDDVARAYGVNGIPATFIIRADGLVHAQHVGGRPDLLELLKAEVQGAIAAVEQGAPPTGDVAQ